MNVVLPVVEKRFRERKHIQSSTHVDAIDWCLELSENDSKEYQPRRIALQILHNLWAGSAAPGGLVVQMIFQTLIDPQYLEPLREEAERQTSQHGWSDKALDNMVLLDSFIRELNRMYPTGSSKLPIPGCFLVANESVVTCARTVTSNNFQFHDGYELPIGSRIAFPAMAIQQDPENFEDPLEFNGFRFARRSQEQEHDELEQKWRAASISETNLA